MNRSMLVLGSALLMLASLPSQAAVQTYKTCTTGPLTPSGFSQTPAGPFKILVQFDDTGYFVNFVGQYGARNPRVINQTLSALRTNAVDTNGREIFSLSGSGQTPTGTLNFVLTLTDSAGPAFIRIQDMSKSTWQGRAICR